MTALVASSASAQATDTDLAGLKVRSKPATGTPPRGASGHAANGLAADRVGTGGEHVLQVLFGDLGAGADAPPAVEVGQAGAHEHPRRGAGGGVVAGQGVGALRRPVAGGHRAQQVAVAPAQADPADRDQWRLPGPAPVGGPHKKRRNRPGYPRSGRLVQRAALAGPSALPGQAKKKLAAAFSLSSGGGCCQAANSGLTALHMRAAGAGVPECRGCVVQLFGCSPPSGGLGDNAHFGV